MITTRVRTTTKNRARLASRITLTLKGGIPRFWVTARVRAFMEAVLLVEVKVEVEVVVVAE